MKAYITATGAVFGLITVAHICRIVAEGGGPAKDPWFIALTLLAAALAVWAWRCLRRLK